MPKFASGDHVRISHRPNSNLKEPLTYPYMEGITGTVANVYGSDEIVVEVDLESLPKIVGDVHMAGAKRLRAKFADSVGEEARKKLTTEELNFTPHFVVMVTEADLEKV